MRSYRRVLIASKDASARARVLAAARAAGQLVCGYASSADDALAKALRTEPDLCLLDLDLPGGGLRAAAQIAEDVPRTGVVVLSSFATAGIAAVGTGTGGLAIA